MKSMDEKDLAPSRCSRLLSILEHTGIAFQMQLLKFRHPTTSLWRLLLWWVFFSESMESMASPRGLFMLCEIDETCWELTVDCWNPAITTWNVENPVNHVIKYTYQLVQDFFHQQCDGIYILQLLQCLVLLFQDDQMSCHKLIGWMDLFSFHADGIAFHKCLVRKEHHMETSPNALFQLQPMYV